ncbi:MAG: hypothetical protein IPI49_19365 [Myxococcales bacterium]|nr:hypothetical protein [Myxococcales bacterium]
MNCLRGREEIFWEKVQANATHLVDLADVLSRVGHAPVLQRQRQHVRRRQRAHPLEVRGQRGVLLHERMQAERPLRRLGAAGPP